MAAAKKKAISATPPNASASAVVHPGGSGGCVQTPLHSVQSNVCKRKAEEFSSQDCTTDPNTRCPVPEHLFEDGPEAQGTTGELADQRSRHLGSAEGRLAYATVVARVASLQNQVGRTSPQPTVRFPLPHLRQPLGASLSKTWPDHCVARLTAPLQSPK
jgi:hypothetical protein